MKYHRNKDDKKKLMPDESVFSSKESVNGILKEYFVSKEALSLCSCELKILTAYFLFKCSAWCTKNHHRQLRLKWHYCHDNRI